MPEIVYCYTCNRGQPIEVDPARAGWRTCAVCHNDELGETVDPALTGGRVPAVPRDPPEVQSLRTSSAAPNVSNRPRPMASLGSADYCKRCVGAVDTMFDVTGKVICMRCAANVEHRPMPENARDYRKSARGEVDHARAYAPTPRPYATIAAEVAATVERKQAAYGDSFGKSGAVMAILYPAGVPVEQLDDALTIVRVLDKLFRIATDRDALGESPWGDVAGYALLAVRRVEQDKGRA